MTTYAEAHRFNEALGLGPHIKRLVDEAPPLSPERAARIRAILNSAVPVQATEAEAKPAEGGRATGRQPVPNSKAPQDDQPPHGTGRRGGS